MQISLYRTMQEALNNVAKHAQGSQATVSLICQPKRIEFIISNDGPGFISEAIEPDSLGLSIRRERAEAIGARLIIESQIDQGTQSTLVWEDKE